MTTIRTRYDPPPIPSRNFDWSALDDDTYEPGSPIGYGATEAAAIADLKEQMIEDDDPCHGPQDTTCPSCGLGGSP
jgi:hypothetical protein